MPTVRQAQVTYEITKAEIEELIRQHFRAPHMTSINWDIVGPGKVRSASITVIQYELPDMSDSKSLGRSSD